MHSDVVNFVKHCNVCAARKPAQVQPSDKMVSHSKTDRPFEMLALDLIGFLPPSKRGHSFILVKQSLTQNQFSSKNNTKIIKNSHMMKEE